MRATRQRTRQRRGRPRGTAFVVLGAALVAVASCLPVGAAGASSGITPVTQASTSARGVTSNSINVAFPVVNLQALASTYGFAGDVEHTEQAKAINLFVDQINQRPDRVPGREPARQPSAHRHVPAAAGHAPAPGRLLARRADVEAPAGDRLIGVIG